MTLACVIYAGIIWVWRGLHARPAVAAPPRIRFSAGLLVVLVLVQIYLGALVAGIDAGLTYNTWPLIDGAFVPSAEGLWFLSPAWRNIFENHLMVQFLHRMVAYALWAVALWHAVDAARALRAGEVAQRAVWLAVAVTAQAAIGIATLLYQVPISLALLHQGMAIVILTIAVIHAQRLLRRTARDGLGIRPVPAN
jgi:cytochrome c oxidase assembly protein subunit 15